MRATATEAFALSGVSGRNWCGQLSQADAIATVAQAQAIVGLDNDMMHVAGAFGRPLVSLFGSRDPRRHGHGQCMSGLTPDAAAEALQVELRRTSRNIR